VTIAGLSAIAAVLLVLLGPLFVAFFRGGAFDAEDERMTLLALGAFALSVPFDALQYPLSRGLYATRDTLLQVLASFAGLAVSVTVSWTLVGSLGIVAIPVAYAAATGTKSALMAIALAARIRTMQPAPFEIDPEG